MLQVLHSGADGFTAVISTPPPHLEQAGGGCWPSITGMSASMIPGDLMRPCFVFFVPLPPGASPSVDFEVLARSRFDPGRTWRKATVPVVSGSGLETVETYPDAPVSRGPDGCLEVDTCSIAGSDLARVTFYPFVGNDFGSFITGVRVRLSWRPCPGGEPVRSPLLGLLCPEGSICWPSAARRGADGESPFWGHPWARISVSSTGCYSVSCRELEEAGCEIEGAPSASLRMLTGPAAQFDLEQHGQEHQLSEMAIEVFDGGDGVFDGGDSLVFLGTGLNRYSCDPLGRIVRLSHRYSVTNTYWLTWGDQSGLRMGDEKAAPDGSPEWGPSAPDRMTLEQDWLWLPRRETRTGWVWNPLQPDYPSYYGFYTPGVAGTADIIVGFASDSSGPHRNVFYLGDSQLGDTVTWSGYGNRSVTLADVPVKDGTNLLKIITVDDGTGSLGVYFDYLDISWQRSLEHASGRDILFAPEAAGSYTFRAGGFSGAPTLFDWTDLMSPRLLEGFEASGDSVTFSWTAVQGGRLFLADSACVRKPDSISSADPGRIAGTLRGADVIFVAGTGLLEGTQALAAACAARGLDAEAVSVTEVYDEFGQGVEDPCAIRSFIRWMLSSWPSPPRAVVLVGDGTYDPLNHLTPAPDLIPAMVELGYSDGICSDDFYAMVTTGSTMPEVPLCRVPADSPSDLSAFVAKVLGYSSGMGDGDWANRLLLVADDEWGQGLNERQHTKYAEMVADSIVPQSLDRVKFYMVEYPWPVGGREKPEAREAFVQALDRGCAAAVYFGHGSYGQIAHEKLFLSSDIDRLTNGWRLPLFSFASCDVGRFELISTDCMGEEFVMKPSGGAIGTIAATRPTSIPTNKDLFADFFSMLYDDGVLPAEALWASKLLCGWSAYSYNRYYVLFGDGSLPLRRFEPISEPLGIDGGMLLRGRQDSVSASFPAPVTAMLSVGESGRWVNYTCIGDSILTYLKYGRQAFRGTFPTEGDLGVSFFMPVQADTGSLARAAADGVRAGGGMTAWNEWAVVADSGGFSSDSIGPLLEMWMEGHEGETDPSVGSQPVLQARLSDPSGIAVFGGSAGRAVLLTVDKAVFDLSGYFSYIPGSSTEGGVTFEVPFLFDGPHAAILAAWDGMGNGSMDTLSFSVSAASGSPLSQVLVYPNPGEGLRCFSFMTDSPGTAEATVFTITGRAIWRGTLTCSGGYAQILWDGLDMDGDPPASGPYVYRVEFSAADGRHDDSTGILAVIRGD